jgi:hypothetical protein
MQCARKENQKRFYYRDHLGRAMVIDVAEYFAAVEKAIANINLATVREDQ